MKLGEATAHEFIVVPNGDDWSIRLTWMEVVTQSKAVARVFDKQQAIDIAQALNEKHGY